MLTEEDTILREYARRDQQVPAGRYSPVAPANLFMRQVRERLILRVLADAGMVPLEGRRVLDVGCGAGQWLVDCETWGVRRADLAGIDLDPRRAAAARERLGGSSGADIRAGSAKRLPWPDGSFDLVIQSLVFSSIPSAEGRKAVAREMRRVLAPEGLILSYDIAVPNPANARVWAIPSGRLRELFGDCDVRTWRVTLAPPLSRRLVSRSWIAAELLERVRVLNSHLLAVVREAAHGSSLRGAA